MVAYIFHEDILLIFKLKGCFYLTIFISKFSFLSFMFNFFFFLPYWIYRLSPLVKLFLVYLTLYDQITNEDWW